MTFMTHIKMVCVFLQDKIKSKFPCRGLTRVENHLFVAYFPRTVKNRIWALDSKYKVFLVVLSPHRPRRLRTGFAGRLTYNDTELVVSTNSTTSTS